MQSQKKRATAGTVTLNPNRPGRRINTNPHEELMMQSNSTASGASEVSPMNHPLTMSSREIADLCDKRHADVLRDCRTMFEALEIGESSFAFTYTDSQNKQRAEYRLPRDLTMTLVTGYSIPLRKRVIDRLDQLESAAADPMAALNDPATLRHLLLQNAERVLSLESVLAVAQPKAAALERLTSADGTFCITDAAKSLHVQPKALFGWLSEHHWIYRRAGNAHWIGHQDKLRSGLLWHRVEEVTRTDGSTKITEQVRVTARGLAKLAELCSGGAS